MEPTVRCGENNRKPVTPIFRWAGSKRKILPVLETYWNPQRFKRYVEPFAGSAALFFRVQPNSAVLADLNSELIEAYEVIRESPDDVHSAVIRIARNERTYYRVRAKNPRRLGRFERSVRFVYLNRHCFNGIYRTNQLGEFNVPYAGVKPGSVPPIEEFRRCANLLHRANLKSGDFGSILSAVRKNDFVYLDPPYALASRRVFRQYGERTFAVRDLTRLAEHLERIDKTGARFVVSYADCREARELLSSWHCRRVKVRRHIAGFASSRRSAFELIITNG